MAERMRRPLPELAPLPGQVDDALREVHRRRRRSLATFGSSVAVAALLLALTHGAGPDDTAGIEPTAPGGTGTATAVPSSRGHRGETTQRATGPRLATAAPAPVTTPAAPEPAPVRPPAVTGRGGTAIEAFGEYRPRVSIKRTVRNYATESCHPCPDYSMTPDRGGLAFSYGFVPVPGEEITFPSSQEVEAIVLTAEGDVLWRWSDGQEFEPYRHDVTFTVGDRVAWHGWWDLVLDDGRRLPQGAYLLDLTLLTDRPEPHRMEFFIDASGNPYFSEDRRG